jgi:alpha-L-rhamnosidase
MKNYSLSLLMGLFFSLSNVLFAESKCIPTFLRCEYLVNPIGIDVSQPRLSWILQDDRRGASQTAYQIMVATDSLSLIQGKPDCWNSGKIKSSKTIAISYAGKTLQARTRYYWCVVVWDMKGNPSPLSRISFWETGLIGSNTWKGDWITDTRDINLKPAPYFRKVFNASNKIKRARAYIAVAGLYELYLNGHKIGDSRLDPMYTRFDRRTLYLTHDVTTLLHDGKNAIGVLLGNGWYNLQSTAVWYFDKATWRARPKFCMDLYITYQDGSEETISTGTDWKTSLSPIIFNSIYTGEHYDARLEQPGWNTVDFDDSSWKSVFNTPAPSTNIVAQSMHPIRNVEEVPMKTMTRVNDTTYLFDLGRNIAGISKLKVNGTAGTVLRLKHAERLNGNKRVDQSNIDVHYRPTDESDPFQTDIIILSGKGEETFIPHFNYKGFQYVEVTSNKPVELSKESLTAYFMHSDVPEIGHMNFSNPIMNKILFATKNSYLSNLFGYPTDCPQREKNGWTGDAHIACETGLYNFDGITIYEKWLADHRDEQQPNGVLPAIIPTDGWGYEWANGPDWTSTIALIPWNIYLFYGDAQLLERCYDNIKHYVDHITEISPSGLTNWGLGDWVPIKSQAPKELTSSAYYFVDASILAKAAKILGKKADYITYSALSDQIKNAINAKYLNNETGIYGTGLQTELSVPLQWGIVPKELKQKVADNLAKRVLADNDHLDVGLLGTKAILNALSENGYADLAYTLASQETLPSWGWWMVNGATTLYENWPINAKSDISMNHIMFGEIGAWCYKALGGIFPDPESPGFKNIIIKPNFVTGLNHTSATMETVHGKVATDWIDDGQSIVFKLIVPPNSTATLYLPMQKEQILYESGNVVDKKNNFIREKFQDTKTRTYQVIAGNYEFKLNK